MTTSVYLTYTLYNTYRIPIEYLIGFPLKSPIEHPIEYPIDRDSQYGNPVEAKDLTSPQLNCSLCVRGAHEGNQEPRRMAIELPDRRPYSYLTEYTLYVC